jgi:type IV pilus assembly protein PilM
MLSTGKKRTVVGLDIETGSAAATEVSENGHASVTRFGTVPLGIGVFREGEVRDAEALGEALKELFTRSKLSKNVRLGLASQRVAVRTLRMPKIEDSKELETAVRFQAQDQIPMPLDQAVMDWQVVGETTDDSGARFQDVVAVAARRETVRGLLAALRAAGLRPVGVDLSAFGMIRALARESHAAIGLGDYVDAPADASGSYEDRVPEHLGGEGSAAAAVVAETPAYLYCNLGDITNLAVARGDTCLFTRISPFGIEGIAQKLAERRQLQLDHARGWLRHVGLESPVEGIEGETEIVAAAREALAEGAGRLVDELRLSLEYYAAQDGSVPIDGIVACGPGTTIPGLVDRLQRDLGQRFVVGRPQALAHLDDETAARLAVSFGLGLGE